MIRKEPRASKVEMVHPSYQPSREELREGLHIGST